MRGTAASPAPEVRTAVCNLLSASADFFVLDPATRRAIAGSLVRIAATAQALADERTATAAPPPRGPVALAMNAGSEFSGVAANRVADTTRQILNAVSFPRFVTELINGVFKAMNDSNQQQLASYIELIQNVSNTLDGFADANVGVSGARAWLAERFPGSFVVQGDTDLEPDPGMSAEERRELQQERDASTRLRLVPNGQMPNEAALRSAFGLGPQESVPSAGDPEALVPFARQVIARNRQQMLSTMVMMGLQRIVIESGRLNASMRFHIDTRSAAADDRGSSFDTRTDADVSGGAKFGPWGMEAKVKSTIGYVSTQRTQTTEEMNTDLDLSSNVELIFKTDYVQLDRLAGGPAQERIRVNALNPEAEARLASQDREARRAAQGSAETARGTQLNERMARPGPAVSPSTPPPAAVTPPPAGPAVAPPPPAAVTPPPAGPAVAPPPPAAVTPPPAGPAVATAPVPGGVTAAGGGTMTSAPTAGRPAPTAPAGGSATPAPAPARRAA